MTKKTNEPSGWNPVFEFPLDVRNTIIIDGIKYQKVEEPKPPTLYDALELPYFTNGYMFNKGQKEWICKVVSEWLPNDDPHDGEEFQLGWNACLNYLRENMK
jgi:hypothetical protein